MRIIDGIAYAGEPKQPVKAPEKLWMDGFPEETAACHELPCCEPPDMPPGKAADHQSILELTMGHVVGNTGRSGEKIACNILSSLNNQTVVRPSYFRLS